MNLTDNEMKILMQALVYLQRAIARKDEHICSQAEAEAIKVKLWEACNAR